MCAPALCWICRLTPVLIEMLLHLELVGLILKVLGLLPRVLIKGSRLLIEKCLLVLLFKHLLVIEVIRIVLST
jgi:hypothetical protein